MQGLKHLIQCHCILPQLRKADNPPFHKFITFSVIDDSDTVLPKHAQCDNCGIIHRVFDICKSEIISKKEESNSIIEIADIKMFLDQNVVSVLENYGCDVATWEHAQFILSYEKWGEHITLTREYVDGKTTGKLLMFEGNKKYKVETFSMDETIGENEN